MRNRGFEVVSAYKDKGINIPVRKTRGSAAYDIEAAEDIVIPPYQQGIKPTLIPTGLKAYCRSDEFYILANRSSGPKKGFVMRVMRDIFIFNIIILIKRSCMLRRVML